MSETRRRAASSRDRTAGPRAAVAVAGGLAVVALIAQVIGGSGAGSIEPIVDEVRTAELPCPAPLLTGKTASSSAAIAAPPASAAPVPAGPTPEKPDQVRGSSAVLADLGPPAKAVVRLKLDRSGQGSAAAPELPLLARGTGSLAPGLAADLISAGRTGTARGLEAVTCAAAGASAWFVGASTAAGRRDRLVLTNPEDIPAVVDLDFWDEKGPVAQPPNSTGIDVPALGVVTIPLDGMTAGHQRLAIAVTATSGRVSAVVHDIDEQGIKPRGVDWIAPVAAPTRFVLIPGVADGRLGRTLQLLVPGETDAIVKLRVLTPNNSFAPAALDTVELRAGQVAQYDLSKAGETAASALVVTADRPVVASVRLTRAVKGTADIAYATAAPALSAPALIPSGVGPQGTTTRLILAAPRGDAEVVVTLLGAGGVASKPTVVKIPAARAVLFDPAPKPPKGATGAPLGSYAILLTPGPASGPVFAARILRAADPDLTVTAVFPGRYTVSIPGIEPDLTAVLP
jgi:hypothetical protein